MTSFTFSAEQVRSAPPEVRRWMEAEINRALAGAPHGGEHGAPHAATLAECTPAEAAQIFQLLSGNFLATRVLFELARETPYVRGSSRLHMLNVADLLRHMQLSDSALLVECFNQINRALQNVRNDPNASLFASDEYGHVFVHEATHQSIRQLWEQLVGRTTGAVPSAADALLAGRPGPAGAQSLDDRIQIAPEHAFAPGT